MTPYSCSNGCQPFLPLSGFWAFCGIDSVEGASTKIKFTERRSRMETKGMKILLVSAGLALGLLLTLDATAQEVPRITKEELRAMLDSPDLVIIDDRTGTDWDASEFKIKGAVREDPTKVDKWASKYPKDKPLVFYCA
jgi:hypothetical protein